MMKTTLVSFFVFFGVLLGTYFAYQKWQNSDTTINFSDVASLSQTSKIQSLSIPEGKTLVPLGAIMTENDVNQVVFTYFVDVSEGYDLKASVSDVSFTKNNVKYADEHELLMFTIDVEMIGDTKAKVLVYVSLNMPASEEEFQMIMGSSASFRMNFHQVEQI